MKTIQEKPISIIQTFYDDVIEGLSQQPKQLSSKYFYDENGDNLFKEIMASPEYYLTKCEMEIFTKQTKVLAKIITDHFDQFALIELGAGDCSKSIHLLQELLNKKVDFVYTPIDFSKNIIQEINQTLSQKLPDLQLNPLNGDYFEMLEKANSDAETPKVILFMGSNIGNMTTENCIGFCERLRSNMNAGDIAIIGFDLKKNPRIIRAAYDDELGVTRKFNLNLLSRINRELNANFEVNQFEHYCSYDPQIGACQSYLIALKQMDVNVGSETFSFQKDEYIWMEVSQKFSLEDIHELAGKTGFLAKENILDSQEYFADAIWIAD